MRERLFYFFYLDRYFFFFLKKKKASRNYFLTRFWTFIPNPIDKLSKCKCARMKTEGVKESGEYVMGNVIRLSLRTNGGGWREIPQLMGYEGPLQGVNFKNFYILLLLLHVSFRFRFHFLLPIVRKKPFKFVTLCCRHTPLGRELCS